MVVVVVRLERLGRCGNRFGLRGNVTVRRLREEGEGKVPRQRLSWR